MERSENAKPRRRAVILSLVVLAILVAYCARLFQIQIIDGADYEERSHRQTTIDVLIEASRGEIYDRNGIPLAVNRTSFELVFDYAFFPHGAGEEIQRRQNEIIASLIELLSAEGCEWSDTLPMTAEAPYAFASGREQSVSRLKSTLRLAEYATAAQCLKALAERYGLTALPEIRQRQIAGVRYEMEQRQFSLTNAFVFASDVTEAVYTAVLENISRYPGVNVQTTPIREYVSGSAAPHLLGRVGPLYAEEYEKLKDQGYQYNDTIGKSGIEAVMESALRGTRGISTIVKSANGTVIEKTITTDPQPGDRVELCLDYRLQQTALEVLDGKITEMRAGTNEAQRQIQSGAVVMIDVKTGGVLVCASWPSYDLATYNLDYNQLLGDPDQPLFNRAVNGIFPCGSTMKPAVALAALTEGVITPTETLWCDGAYHYYSNVGYTPKCMGYHSSLNVVSALSKSCNVFFYDVGRRLGILELNRYAEAFGLGQKTGIEVGESGGTLAGPTEREAMGLVWNPGDTCSAAIGQSDNLFTPLQLAVYASTLANDGVRYRAHLVDKTVTYAGEETVVEPEIAASISLSEEAIRTVRQGMIDAARSGTASVYFADAPYTVACKTGTAETGVNGQTDHGTFIAYAPVEDPQVAIAVVMERGESRPATYVARQLLDAYFALAGEETADVS